MSTSRLILALLTVLPGTGCGFFNPSNTSGDGGTSDGFGYGQPTLEVTINGVHFGPAAPDPTSSASLTNTTSTTTGQLTSTVFRLAAYSPATGASCTLSAQRSGDGVSPIGPGTYLLAPQLGSPRDDSVSPIEGEFTTVPQGTWSCSGASCNGGILSITRLDTGAVEGYFSGSLQNNVNGAAANVVCSFYLPGPGQ